MKRFGLLLALAAVMGFVIVGSAFAAEGKGPGGRPTMGEITKIEGKVLTVKSAREGAEPQTVTCDDNTQITKEAVAKLGTEGVRSLKDVGLLTPLSAPRQDHPGRKEVRRRDCQDRRQDPDPEGPRRRRANRHC